MQVTQVLTNSSLLAIFLNFTDWLLSRTRRELEMPDVFLLKCWKSMTQSWLGYLMTFLIKSNLNLLLNIYLSLFQILKLSTLIQKVFTWPNMKKLLVVRMHWVDGYQDSTFLVSNSFLTIGHTMTFSKPEHHVWRIRDSVWTTQRMGIV